MEKLYDWDNDSNYRVVTFEANSNVIVTDEYFDNKEDALDRLDELTEWDADIVVYAKYNSIPVEEYYYKEHLNDNEEEKEITGYQLNEKLYSTLKLINDEIKRVNEKINKAFSSFDYDEDIDVDTLNMKLDALTQLRLKKFGV